MKQVAFKVKIMCFIWTITIIVDGNKREDIVYNPIATLPKVISPSKVPAPARTKCADGDDSECSSDVDFVDSDYAVRDDDDDLFCDDVDEGVVDEGVAKGIMVGSGRKRFGPVDNEPVGKEWDELDSDEEESELPESGEEGRAGQNMRSFRPEDL
ncbi:unnamed protein product [Miscanthus lutarioriparius]|uniref:Uncharacterized protein n=1 Tax=Miscanthus lutarioriparius TaxID=422564 RepID=A0A811MSS5_9POAL|nr:unnamed protein product [Miscanthus lutarioriparius]